MAFKMKGYPMKDNDTELTPEQRARLAELEKNMKNSGLSEEKYQKMKAEKEALSGK